MSAVSLHFLVYTLYPMLQTFLNRCINHCQYLGCLSFVGMYVVWHNGVVVDAVSLLKKVGVLPVADFHSSFHDHDELFAFV